MSRSSSDSDDSHGRRRSRRKRSSSSSGSNVSHRRRRSPYHSSSRHRKPSKSSRSRRRSSSRSSRRTRSRDRHRRRSYSRERHGHKRRRKSKTRRKSSSRSSQSSSTSVSSKSKSAPSTNKSETSDGIRDKLLKAIQAAESADHQLKQAGVLQKNIKSRNDLSNINVEKPDADLIQEIEADGFVQKTFTPAVRANDEDDAFATPEVSTNQREEKSIFHPCMFVDPKVRMEKWVKKLYQIRQRAFIEPNTG